MRAAPGSPFDAERPLDPATRAAFAAAYGLDKPLPEQAARYLGGVLTGDFGSSLVYKDFTVGALIAQGLPVSLTLGRGAHPRLARTAAARNAGWRFC